jgi:hypothetical protein
MSKIVTKDEIDDLKTRYKDSEIEDFYNEKVKILKGLDSELNDYHLCIEAITNRFEKSLWDLLRILTPMTRKECIEKYYGEDLREKGKFIRLKTLHSLVKEKVHERNKNKDTNGNILSDEDTERLNQYLDSIYPFFDIRNYLAHTIKDYIKNIPPIHPLDSSIQGVTWKEIKRREDWKYEIIKGHLLWLECKDLIQNVTKNMNGLSEEHFNLWSDIVIM